ncbi:MAG TPA: VWA domain-containing protein [Myxococcales bacterium]
MESRSGRYVRAAPLEGQVGADLAADATLRAAALRSLRGEEPLPVRRGDLRRKVRARTRKSLVVFAVDASDSMATHERLRVAKGAALSLLRAAYLRRDRVAVVVFEGEAARVLLAPTQSIDLARAKLRRLPIGGATPLAAGLMAAWDLIRTERLREPQTAPTLVLLSDGRANVPLDPRANPQVEVLGIVERIRGDGIGAVLVDAGSLGPTPAQLVELAERMGGTLVRVGPGGTGAVVAACNEAWHWATARNC